MSYYVENEIKELENGKKYTLISVGEMLAMTTRTEIQLIKQEVIKYAQYNQVLKLYFKVKRKRSIFTTLIKTTTAIIEGWDLPIKLDTEQTGSFTMSGNALINLIVQSEAQENQAKDVFNKNINPYFEHGLIIIHNGDEEKPLFMDKSKKIMESHAPLKGIINLRCKL